MASLPFYDMPFLFIVLLISIATVLYRRRRLPITNWPFIGMAPDLLVYAHRIHDRATLILKLSNGTFMFKGPWFANMDMLGTCDPANIHHMLSKNFPNYPKGPEFRSMFDILGDGIFNSDHELWEIHRRTTMSLLKHPNIPTLLETNIRNKVENGLLPILDFVSSHNQEIDLQEIFQRFAFDAISLFLLDYDPESLSIDLPYIPCEKAFTDAEEALFWRHVLPEKVWKLQKRLGLGKEKKLSEAWKAFDEFIYTCLSRKEVVQEDLGLLTSLKRDYEGQSGTSGDARKFLKDIILNLMVAGRDSTGSGLSWFFYLLTQNPSVEKKIREEIKKILGGRNWKSLGVKELGGFVYLNGGIHEALRLYPPVALERKSPTEADILPSGHVVDKHTRIILSFYSMGRQETIWGEDCMEFKPERWISQGGGIKNESSYKFTAFHAGPRTCVGKDMSLIQMKMLAIAIICNYHVELVKGHQVCPSDSVILQMKYGLKVRLFPVNINGQS
uniref:alkane hydroxylase MAH1-like n=1 Tax=Erigeron canadensis TaxID=72917 RepID=UPI001CB8DDD9|nr:alkane hydroxylase MAH1-like [Erigeron canadensis]